MAKIRVGLDIGSTAVRASEVAVGDVPPAVRIVATIPVRTPFFGVLISRPWIDLPIRATASAR